MENKKSKRITEIKKYELKEKILEKENREYEKRLEEERKEKARLLFEKAQEKIKNLSTNK